MNSTLVNIGVGVVGLFAVPLLTALFANLLHKLAAKASLDINQQQEAQIKVLAGEAALFAEEWAAAKLKATKNKPSPDDKMDIAVGQLQKDLPGLSNGTAVDLIKTALPKLRLGALFSKVAGILTLLILFAMPVFAAHPDQKAVVSKAKADLIAAGADLTGPCGAFKITDLAAWRLKAQGDTAGILSKPNGNNCQGFATDIIAYPDGQIYDVLIDGGATNGPNWGDDGTVDAGRYRPPVDPHFDPTPVPAPGPVPGPVVDLTPRVEHLEEVAQALVAATNKLGEQTQALMALANDTSARVSILELKPIPVACSAAVFGIPIHCALSR